VANTAVTWPGRLRQIHSFFCKRSPDQMLATAAPWTSPWFPPGYEQNFWNAALEGLDGVAVIIGSIAGPPDQLLGLFPVRCQAARWAWRARSS
jgi:hypothetical protein